MKKDPAEKEETKRRKAEAEAREERIAYIDHKEANAVRLSRIAKGRTSLYVIGIFGALVLAVAFILVAIISMWDKETAHMAVPFFVIGGVMLVVAIAIIFLLRKVKKDARRFYPILTKEVEVMRFELAHPEETEAAKTLRLNKVKAYFKKLLASETITQKDYDKALSECGIAPDEPVEEEGEQAPTQK